jgi:predicted O-methyltransferase YrrM
MHGVGAPSDLPEAQRARYEAQIADARGRYDALRSRKAVRIALAAAALRHRIPHLLSGDRHAEAAAAPPPPPVDAAAAPSPPPVQAAPVPGPSPEAGTVAHPWPLGHFYSPVPDTVALASQPLRDRIWPPTPRPTPGIDWRDEQQVALVRDVLARQPALAFARAPTGDPTEYHTQNPFFSQLDAWALQGMLRHLRPRRMIEVGSGFSSLVAARVNRECLHGAMDLTCVEPYPVDYLGEKVDGLSRLIESPVQDVALQTFTELGDGDVLFIDSSHVMKTGSDVQYLYHEVLPRLRSGVVVHIHDIFLPHDYPADWVLSGRGWNEQYVLQSFLAFNAAFEVLLGIGWMCEFHPDVLAGAIPGFPATTPDGGGSFWMRRV